jgi:PAS domain S-box-containing protein
MDNYSAYIYMKDEAGGHIYANKAVLALTSMALEDWIGTRSHDLFDHDISRKMEEADQIVLAEKTPIEIEFRAAFPDGKSRWVRDIKFPIHLGPEHVWVGGICVDITSQKRAQDELRTAYAEIKTLKDRLEAENIYLREEIELSYRHEQIVGESQAIKSVLSQAEQVAATESTVLLLGETGTGKELLAHAIHKMSARRDRPLLTVNCAALPASLIESELFGREKGAYTGALTKQIGRFEVADGSTIFLDEISELPLDLQIKLLRVIEVGRFERLGSSKTLTVDVRVIVATNKDLAEAVRAGRFREDLYYRLNVFPIEVPALRKRREDIPLLVWAFVKDFGKSMGKTIDYIPRRTMDGLQRYLWPGNVRELRNVIERAMILTTGSTLRIEVPKSATSKAPRLMALQDVERKHILEVLESTSWRVRGQNGAAAVLGLKPTTLESRMSKLGIKRPE